MPVNTDDIFEQDLGSSSYEDRRQTDSARRYEQMGTMYAGLLARRAQERRRIREEAEAEQQAIEDRAAEYTDFENHADTATHHTIASRGMQGAAFGPWGALAGAVIGTGESLARGYQAGGWDGVREVGNQMLNPEEFIPGSLSAVGDQFQGRNASGIDNAALGASRFNTAGTAVQQGWNSMDFGGDSGAVYGMGDEPYLGGNVQSLPGDPGYEAPVFDTNAPGDLSLGDYNLDPAGALPTEDPEETLKQLKRGTWGGGR